MEKKIASVDSTRLYYEIVTATYYVLGDTDRTIALLKEYVDFCKNNGFGHYLHFIFGNIATIQLDLKDYEGASATLEEVKTYADKGFSVAYLVDMARLKLEQNQTGNVLDYLQEAFNRPELSENYLNKVEVYLLFATYYALSGEIVTSNQWYEDTVMLIENHEFSYEERSVYKRLAKVMALQERYKESNGYLNKYIELIESVIKKERELMATKASLKYTLVKKNLKTSF